MLLFSDSNIPATTAAPSRSEDDDQLSIEIAQEDVIVTHHHSHDFHDRRSQSVDIRKSGALTRSGHYASHDSGEDQEQVNILHATEDEDSSEDDEESLPADLQRSGQIANKSQSPSVPRTTLHSSTASTSPKLTSSTNSVSKH